MAGEEVAIRIPKELFERLQERAKEEGFEDPRDYIIFILEEAVREGEEVFTPEEEEAQVPGLPLNGLIWPWLAGPSSGS